MRDALAKLIPSLVTPATQPQDATPPPPPTDPKVMALLLEIQRRVVRIETRQAKFMQAQGVDLGNYTR